MNGSMFNRSSVSHTLRTAWFICLNIDWRHFCVSSVTGVLWFQLKSPLPAACQSTRWARPPPAEHPPLAAHPTFLLLRQQHPRAWSTLQVREQRCGACVHSCCSHQHHLWWNVFSYQSCVNLFSLKFFAPHLISVYVSRHGTLAVWNKC